MPISIKCPVCNNTTRGIRSDMRGKRGQCPLCKSVLDVSKCEIHEDVKQDRIEKLTPEKINDDFLRVAKNVEIAGWIVSSCVAFGLFFNIMLTAIPQDTHSEGQVFFVFIIALFFANVSWWFVNSFFAALVCIIRILVSQKRTLEAILQQGEPDVSKVE